MRVVIWSRGKDLDARGRGEERWNLGFTYFLKSEGIDTKKVLPNLRYKSDLYLDAPDDCSYLYNKRHVHFKFSPFMPELKEFPCYKEGELILANPYKASFEAGKKFWENDRRVKFIFLPMAYPDKLLPKDLKAGFGRETITWASKEGAAAELEKSMSYNHSHEVVYNAGLDALYAVLKLSKRADFTFTCIMFDKLGAEGSEILKQLPSVKKYRELPWSQLLDKFKDSKMNLSPGGSAGCILESIFTKGLAVQNAGCFLDPPAEICLLDKPGLTDRKDWEMALETFWFDEVIYNRAWQYYQDVFKDHRTDGLRKAWKEALEIIRI